MLASSLGHLAVVEWLLGFKEVRDRINLKNRIGETALSFAVRDGRDEVAALLIDNGATK